MAQVFHPNFPVQTQQAHFSDNKVAIKSHPRNLKFFNLQDLIFAFGHFAFIVEEANHCNSSKTSSKTWKVLKG